MPNTCCSQAGNNKKVRNGLKGLTSDFYLLISRELDWVCNKANQLNSGKYTWGASKYSMSVVFISLIASFDVPREIFSLQQQFLYMVLLDRVSLISSVCLKRALDPMHLEFFCQTKSIGESRKFIRNEQLGQKHSLSPLSFMKIYGKDLNFAQNLVQKSSVFWFV